MDHFETEKIKATQNDKTPTKDEINNMQPPVRFNFLFSCYELCEIFNYYGQSLNNNL